VFRGGVIDHPQLIQEQLESPCLRCLPSLSWIGEGGGGHNDSASRDAGKNQNRMSNQREKHVVLSGSSCSPVHFLATDSPISQQRNECTNVNETNKANESSLPSFPFPYTRNVVVTMCICVFSINHSRQSLHLSI
jgi:hypothetical protein